MLAARHIPFQISLIPVFRDPRQGLDVRLSYRRNFVDAIHYMVSRGGTPVMHGVTHQYRGVSADDYEFWVDPGDHPVAGDSTDFVLDRLQFGLAECFGSGIYPIAFETPHYSASEADYLAIGRVFSISNESVMVAPQLNSVQFFPYPVVDRVGRYVIPEDLGYLPEGNPDPKPVIEYAHKLRVVRDGIASFYFHSFLDRKLLEQTVDGIIAAGYHFVSLREFGGVVDAQGRYIVRTVSGTARVRPRNEYWRLRLFDAAGQTVKTDFSPTRLSGPVDVAVQVPAGGWAALDCIKNLPRDMQQRLSWASRLRQWWDGLHPEPQAGFAAPVRKFIAGKDAWILWLDRPPAPAARDQESYRTVLEAFGYRAKQVNIRDFVKAPAQSETILVVPRAAAASLNQAQHHKILQYLTDGGQVVMEGRQPWLEKLGFEFSGRQMPVSRLSDPDYPEMTLSWRPEEVVEQFTAPEGVHELMADPASGQPVALAGSHGSGHYIYLAAPLDTHTADGTSHYPYFPRYLSDTFGPATSLRGQHIEAYFDPSYRPGADLNRLAVYWRQSGIRTVYVAAWLFTKRYSFPYAEFIHACHRNGVAVYAWFVFPEVTQKMWDEHPEWREKTAAGTDGQVGWRYAMNFQNPACFRAAMDWMNDLLRSNEWDGVNITELNFDAAIENWLRAEVFVPMNDEVRADFRRKAGFDPLLLFKPGSPYDVRTNPAALEKFLHYREDIVTDWHRRVLAEIEPLRKERGWEVIVTALDSLHVDYAKPRLGVDSRRIAGLMKDFPFTLQVEDPVQFWMRAPDRYLRFAKTYSKLVRDPRRLMFDVNVMPNRDISSTFLPSATATGVELALTLAAASSPSGRVAVYSENTVPVQDWPLLRMALARPATITAAGDGWQVASPGSVLLSPAENKSYYVDGRLWPAGSIDGVLAPAGRHTISAERLWWRFFDPVALPARVLSCTADLLEARADATSLMLRYSSPGRAVIQLSEQPRDILVDDKRPVLTVEPSGSYWAVTLPGGEHRVTIVTNTPAGVAVDAWSWVSASVIAAFGALTTLLMVGIYLHIRLRRLGKRRG